MTSRPSRLERWRDRRGDRRALEERAALLADAARDVPAIAPEALARVRAQVLARRPLAAEARRGIARLSIGTRLALAAALLVVSIATARGAGFLWRSYFRPAPAPARVDAPPAPQAARGARARANRPSPAGNSAEAQLAPPAPAPSSATPPLGGAEPAIARRVPRASAGDRDNIAAARAGAPFDPVPPVTAAPDRSAANLAPAPPAGAHETEAGLLAQALTQLRQQNDPRATLATLDRHARDFPHGVLEAEARGIRVEAALQLKDRKMALALLDAPPATPDTLGAKLVIARAELRASADRCGDAVADFTWILDSASVTRGGDIDERAWHGRALCLERLGLKARARADLATYLRLYPRGRFATEVTRLLVEDPGETRP